MANREMPVLQMIVTMFLLAPNIHVHGGIAMYRQMEACPKTVVAMADMLPGTRTSYCQMSKGQGQLTARCDPYCGKQYPHAVYVFVVVGRSCTNVKRVAINTLSFSDAGGFRASTHGLLGLCKGFKAFVSERFTFPGAICDNQPYPTDVNVSLYDSCNNIVDDCETVHIIQRTCHEPC